MIEKTKKEQEPSFKNKLITYSLPIIIIVLIIIGIIIIFTIPKVSKKDEHQDSIKYVYKIDTIDLSTDSISPEYKKQNEFDIYGGGLKLKITKIFNLILKEHNVGIILYENKINMDYIFKDISTLKNIQMI